MTLPTGDAKTAYVRSMFDTIAPRYDLVNRMMTFGMDGGWRKRTVAALALPRDSVILDLACGTGDLSRLAEKRGLRVVGVDLSAGMLAASNGVAGAQCDGAALGLRSGIFDGVVCGYALRNFTDLPVVLAEAARVTRPGGRLSVLEVATPHGLLRHGHRLWFEHAVPRIGGFFSDKEAYRYLPKSTAYLPPIEELRRMLLDAGYRTVGHRLLQGGLSQIVTATRGPDAS